MVTTSKLKASDRQALVHKVVTILRKRYGGSLPKEHRNVLETMLFAVCLENSSHAAADEALKGLLASFHDLNEIRVSSVSELEQALGGLNDADWKALRMRDILHYVFEKYYAFDFEPLRRKTTDLAVKQLAKIKTLTPFVQTYTLQHSLGSHAIPLDDVLCRVLAWLGLIAPSLSTEQAAEELKPVIRKSDVTLACHLLRAFGTDPTFAPALKITKGMLENGEVDAATGPDRLTQLLAKPPAKASKTARKKPAAVARSKSAARKQQGKSKTPITRKVSRPKPRTKQSAKRTPAASSSRKK
jgi:endonuclease-3